MPAIYSTVPDFHPKDGADIFSVTELLQLTTAREGVANPSGDLIFVPVSKHSFKDKKASNEIYVLPLKPDAFPPPADAKVATLPGGDAFWLDARTLAHVVDEGDGKQRLYAVQVSFSSTSNEITLSSLLAGTFPAKGLANFKYSLEGKALVFSTYAWPEMDLTTAEAQDKEYENRGDDILVYDDPFVRHWDSQIGPKRPTLFSVTLQKEEGKWTLHEDYVAPLKESGHETPVEPWGGTNHFDVSLTHIVYTTKDPKLPVQLHTRQNVYIVPIKGGEAPRELTSGTQGSTSSPIFGRNGTLVAWTELKTDKYESDRSQVILYDLESQTRYNLTPSWNLTAERLYFSSSGESLLISAKYHTRAKVFQIPLPSSLSSLSSPSGIQPPILIPTPASATSPQPLPNSRLLFTGTSISSPNDIFLLSDIDSNAPHLNQITHFTKDELTGKAIVQPEDFWFEGSEGREVHTFVLPPKGYRDLSEEERRGKKWPVLFAIHGGPQYGWWDEWDTRWNFNVFAHQGYFVVAPNPTGSISFGQDFVDSIHNDWTGKPFEDLKKGWLAVQKQYPEMDSTRAVAAGHSWGGFAAHWIQGHPEYEFGFKAFIVEAGMFDLRYFMLATEELYFAEWDLGVTLFTDEWKVMADKLNPANFINNFSKPELILHSAKDYRVPETEALSAFNLFRARGIDSRLVYFPSGNHMVADPPQLKKWYYEILRWLAKYTREESLV